MPSLWSTAGREMHWSSVVPPGSTMGDSWGLMGCEHPSPTIASWLCQMKDGSNWEHWWWHTSSSNMGCTGSDKGCSTSRLSSAPASPRILLPSMSADSDPPPFPSHHKHFQEQEVSLSQHSLSVTETSSQLGTQIFS